MESGFKRDTVPAMAPVLLLHPSSLEHDTGAHPEQASRIAAIERVLESRRWLGWERMQSPAVNRMVLTAVHREEYVSAIERMALAGGGHLDLDTVVSSGSWGAALHAAGGGVRMVDLLLDGDAPCAFSVHRPPGHHALASRGMGFCLFNNVAVAAQYALRDRGLDRVMIFDWDVHHGNGTNDIFHDSDQVLFVSIHQSPLYPGTGAAWDVGAGRGSGFTVNLPVSPGADDDLYMSLLDGVVVPLARAFEPQLMLISAGYDSHRDDPLADCALTEVGYAAMTSALREVCDALDVPIGVVLEGGYALVPLATSVVVTMVALAARDEKPLRGRSGSAGGGSGAAATSLVDAARGRLAKWWPELR